VNRSGSPAASWRWARARLVEQFLDGGGRDDLVAVTAGTTLKQVRQHRSEGSFVVVVTADQRHRPAVSLAQPGDDRREHAGQLRRHQQQPFLVVLRWQDLQQWNEVAGVAQPVGHQRQVGDLEELFVADAGVPQRLDDRPRPERVVLGGADVGLFAGLEMLDKHDVRPRA
jgi:hypothetical protein